MILQTTRRPTVGLVMPLASQQGGAESLFQHLLHAPHHLFQYTCLFLQDGPLIHEARSLGYAAAVLPTTHLSDVRNYASTLQGVRSWIRQCGVDLVFSWMLKANLYAGPAALSLNKKLMWFQHGIAKRHWMDLVGGCLPADGILCCSDHAKMKQDEHFMAAPTFVCHPGVPIPERQSLTRAEARLRLQLDPDAQIICMVARLERWKGAHVFVEAARTIAMQFPRASFVVVGGVHPLDRGYATELEQSSRTAGLAGRLHLVGQRPAAEIPLWHASADIVVHPVTEAEPFGMAVVEAMAAGRAVVASSAGGIAEIIEDGVSGLLVPPGDPAVLANAVSKLLLDAVSRERIACAAIARSRAFSVETFAARFEHLISSVLAN